MEPEDFRALLAAAGLTQEEAAAKLNVHRVTVNRWVKDKSNISAGQALLIRSKIKPKKK